MPVKRGRLSAAIAVVMGFLLCAVATSSAVDDGASIQPHLTPEIDKPLDQSDIGATGTDDQPTYIKVAIRPNNNPGSPISEVKNVDFYYYVNHSVPFEWAAGSQAAAFEAGALSVKSYGWYWIANGGKDWPSDIRQQGADVDNTTNSQTYVEADCDPRPGGGCVSNASRSGVYQTAGKVLKNGTQVYLANHLRGFCDPNNDGVKDSNCYYDDRYQMADNTISQEGSRYLADQGGSRNSLLTGYYTNPAVTIADTTPPEVRSFWVSGVTNTSITLQWLNYPGDTSSEVGKWNPSSRQYDWTRVTGASSYTYQGLSPNVFYDFTVRACNSRGCGRRNFGTGWIYASTYWDDTTYRPPTYSVHFITNKEIRFSVSAPNATKYEVYKKVNGQFQGPLTMYSLDEYRETGLAAGITYEYAARALINGTWTEYTNGGSFVIKTYPTR